MIDGTENYQRDQAAEASATRQFTTGGGGDEANTSRDDKDDYLHEEEKPVTNADSVVDIPVEDDDAQNGKADQGWSRHRSRRSQ